MRKLIWTGVLVATMAACGGKKVNLTPIDPFKNADGSVNVTAILNAADFGLQADCALGTDAVAKDVCKYGTQALNAARGVQSKDPAVVKLGVANILKQAEIDVPAVKPYFDFVLPYLQ